MFVSRCTNAAISAALMLIACSRSRDEAPAPIAADPVVPARTEPSAVPFVADGELRDKAVTRALTAIGNDWQNEAAIVRRLSPGLRAIYTTHALESEVLGGGFNQYFWNSNGALADEALAGLRRIGASKHAAILEEAIQLWRAEQPAMERLKASGAPGAFNQSYKQSKLGPLGVRFRNLKPLQGLQADYIRAHPQDFE